jgi:hypothetical protein
MIRLRSSNLVSYAIMLYRHQLKFSIEDIYFVACSMYYTSNMSDVKRESEQRSLHLPHSHILRIWNQHRIHLLQTFMCTSYLYFFAESKHIPNK